MRRHRRSESPPLRKTPSSPPRSIEDAVRKSTRKALKEGRAIDRAEEYERQQQVAQTWYDVNEQDLLSAFQEKHGRVPTHRERNAIERMAEERATQEFVEDNRDVRKRTRGRGQLSNLVAHNEELEPGNLGADPYDYEERRQLAAELPPPPTSLGATVDRTRGRQRV